MNIIEAEYWAMAIPEPWLAGQDEDTIVIEDNDDIGVIEIDTLLSESDTVISEADLNQLAQSLIDEGKQPAPYHQELLNGFCFEYSDDGDWCRDFFLAYKHVVMIVAYTCDIENRGLDDANIDEILSTWVPSTSVEQV